MNEFTICYNLLCEEIMLVVFDVYVFFHYCLQPLTLL